MVWSLLRRYLQVYWLKPFDAVNDAANAWALRQFPWEEPILEVGGGDGVFSFVMHDGEFIATDDRYDQSDPSRPGDIFDVYREGFYLTIKRHASRLYEAGVDLKWSHLLKGRETKLYRLVVLSPPEPLPFAAESFKTVFLYFPHGIHPEGSLLMTAVNRDISDHFVCYPLYRFFEGKGWPRLSEYFKRLDAGRHDEITGFGRTAEEWTKLLQVSGFNLVDTWTQVSPIAWSVYDFQTRPLLRPLIRWNWFLKRVRLKRVVKAAWVYTWLPVLTLFYLGFAKPRRLSLESMDEPGVFFAFRAIPT